MSVTLLSSPLTMAVFPTAVKAVGSVFRYGVDYRDAPPDIRHNALKRESSLLGLTLLTNLAIQKLGVKTIPELMKALTPGLMKEGPAGEAAVMLIRLGLAIPGNAIAEGVSRLIGKPPDWNQKTSMSMPATPEFQPVRRVSGVNEPVTAYAFGSRPVQAPNPFAISTPFA